MELNDKEFDATFRRKVFDADPQFEDAAWDKMERKLRRRDRIVIFRRSAVVVLLLVAGVGGYFSMDVKPERKDSIAKVKPGQVVLPSTERVVVPLDIVVSVPKAKVPVGTPAVLEETRNSIASGQTGQVENLHGEASTLLNAVVADGPTDTLSLTLLPIRGITASWVKGVLPGKKDLKVKRNLPVSLAISAGPEFNSASSVVGGDPGFSAGLTLGFGISRKLDLQAGVRYSLKKYNSGPDLKYSFPGTSAWMQNNLTGLNATCDVLEIPVQASYQIMTKGTSSVNLNAGVSSYLMLKENYTLKYNSLYGQSSYDLQKRNANTHLLSIVDLSATYFVKVQHTNLKVGLEPFVKIPLSGVGEGNINLKSSGISLKIRYDLDKKNN